MDSLLKAKEWYIFCMLNVNSNEEFIVMLFTAEIFENFKSKYKSNIFFIKNIEQEVLFYLFSVFKIIWESIKTKYILLETARLLYFNIYIYIFSKIYRDMQFSNGRPVCHTLDSCHEIFHGFQKRDSQRGTLAARSAIPTCPQSRRWSARSGQRHARVLA